MDAEVKNEEVADGEQIPILIEPKQEINESLELIEPKVELIDEMDVKKEELDDNEYQHIIPYEFRDYMEQHSEEEQPTSSRKRQADDSSISKRKTIECLKCGKEISLSTSTNLSRHAIRHAGLKMFECPANQCNFKTCDSANVTEHMKRKHKSCTDPVRKIEMSNEERRVLNDMIQECFPELDKLNNVTCQLCHQGIRNSERAKREHSNGHIDPILFKCKEEDCDFSTNWSHCFFKHVYSKHRKSFNRNDRNQLFLKQHMKMQKWNDTCFSSKDVKEEDLTETIDYPAPVAQKLVVPKKRVFVPKGSLEQDEYIYQICKRAITENGCDTTNRRIHASEHMDILLCSVPNCQFQTKYLVAMNNHQLTVHVSEPASSSGTSFQMSNYFHM